MSARCIECGGVTVERNGALVIQHNRDCETGNDYQPKLSETLSMRDIVVPSSLDELRKVLDGLLEAKIADASKPKPLIEAHFVLECAENRGFDGSFIEMRGHVRNVLDDAADEDTAVRRVFVTLDTEKLRAFAYKSTGTSDERVPVEESAIDVSRLLRGDGTFELIFLSFQLVSVSLIHVPSPRIPMVNQNH